jgi:hypothetical protein
MEVQRYKEVVRLLDSLSTLINDEDKRKIRIIKDKYSGKVDDISLLEMTAHNATNREMGSFRCGLKKMVSAVYKNDLKQLHEMCEKTKLDEHLIYSKIQCTRRINGTYSHWEYKTKDSKEKRKMFTAVDKLIKTEIMSAFYNQHKSKLILK